MKTAQIEDTLLKGRFHTFMAAQKVVDEIRNPEKSIHAQVVQRGTRFAVHVIRPKVRELPQAGQSVWVEIWNAETGEDEGQMLVVEKIESGIVHCEGGNWFAVGIWLAGNGEIVK